VYLFGHNRKALGMSLDEIREVAMAAILHDIGKCKIPLEI
jgi:HD-GYP domain-containing protein (c-di-GMP phosphodiesterase class II)